MTPKVSKHQKTGTLILTAVMIAGAVITLFGYVNDQRSQAALRAQYGHQVDRWADIASETQAAPPQYWRYKNMQTNGMLLLTGGLLLLFVHTVRQVEAGSDR